MVLSCAARGQMRPRCPGLLVGWQGSLSRQAGVWVVTRRVFPFRAPDRATARNRSRRAPGLRDRWTESASGPRRKREAAPRQAWWVRTPSLRSRSRGTIDPHPERPTPGSSHAQRQQPSSLPCKNRTLPLPAQATPLAHRATTKSRNAPKISGSNKEDPPIAIGRSGSRRSNDCFPPGRHRAERIPAPPNSRDCRRQNGRALLLASRFMPVPPRSPTRPDPAPRKGPS